VSAALLLSALVAALIGFCLLRLLWPAEVAIRRPSSQYTSKIVVPAGLTNVRSSTGVNRNDAAQVAKFSLVVGMMSHPRPCRIARTLRFSKSS
jgi:hypothetical protein